MRARGEPIFDAGYVERTPEATLSRVLDGVTESSLIQRHECGDHGEIDPAQARRNVQALRRYDGTVRSRYRLPCGRVLIVETGLVAGCTTVRLAGRGDAG